MTSDEAKKMADEFNRDNIDKADGDLDHVLIEIQESANKGNYNLEYEFHPSKDYSLVNEIRNHLLKLGYKVELEDNNNSEENSFSINIDWSIEEE
jgi:hypothetical protein